MFRPAWRSSGGRQVAAPPPISPPSPPKNPKPQNKSTAIPPSDPSPAGKRVFHRENGARQPGTALHPPHVPRSRQVVVPAPSTFLLKRGESITTTPRVFARQGGSRRPGSPLHPPGSPRRESASPPRLAASPRKAPEGRRRMFWRGVAQERAPGGTLHPPSPARDRRLEHRHGWGGGRLPEEAQARQGALPGKKSTSATTRRNSQGLENAIGEGEGVGGEERYFSGFGARKPGTPLHPSPPRSPVGDDSEVRKKPQNCARGMVSGIWRRESSVWRCVAASYSFDVSNRPPSL